MTAAAYTAGPQAPPWPMLAHALLGTAMVIAGAVALNQRFELRATPRWPAPPGARCPAGG